MTSLESITGLTDVEVVAARKKFGTNATSHTTNNPWLAFVKDLAHEPMVLLLIVASSLYFIHGDYGEGTFLAIAIIFVFSISRYQESRSKKALSALERLTQPNCKVIRNATTKTIATADLVVGDVIVVEEGTAIPADGVILLSHDFAVNESILTGESYSVYKSEQGSTRVFKGTTVAAGSAVCRVTEVGDSTKIGGIGRTVQSIAIERSPLQIQIATLVTKMSWGGLVIFLIILVFNLFQSVTIVTSLLNSLTLAMSLLPEEIPVAVSTFLALGARFLLRSGTVIKRLSTVETLGAASVICIDKTGTITRNEMKLTVVYDHAKKEVFSTSKKNEIREVVTWSMWASEPMPFDPMEIEIHKIYQEVCEVDLRTNYTLIKEYPLGGRPPFMTHVFRGRQGEIIIAAKGAAEGLLKLSTLNEQDKILIAEKIDSLSAKGYRVLAVAEGVLQDPLPDQQQNFLFNFKGLVGFFDPPKDNISTTLKAFYDAGIKVKILTGDNSTTTAAVGNQIGFRLSDHNLSGEDVMRMSDNELGTEVGNVNMFSRMFPEAKLRVINALKSNGEIVAMTGDGVNDGPALKAAHIGIAMGIKGSEVAKEASAMILPDDDLAHMVDAVSVGRKIHSNLKKAIRYIISIHLPIIIIVFIPLVMGWLYPVIFTPVHVIFLELIMGPTCSIVFENESLEKGIMMAKPRALRAPLFTSREMILGIVQGMAIGGGLLFIYNYCVRTGLPIEQLTTMVFFTIISANIFLMLVNRSFTLSVLSTLRSKNKLVPGMILLTICIVTAIYLTPPLKSFFHFGQISVRNLGLCIVTGFISAIWIEVYKYFVRRGKIRL